MATNTIKICSLVCFGTGRSCPLVAHRYRKRRSSYTEISHSPHVSFTSVITGQQRVANTTCLFMKIKTKLTRRYITLRVQNTSGWCHFEHKTNNNFVTVADKRFLSSY